MCVSNYAKALKVCHSQVYSTMALGDYEKMDTRVVTVPSIFDGRSSF